MEAEGDPQYVLLVVDGTWKQGLEIFKRVAPIVLPPRGPATQVTLPPGPPSPHAQQGQQQEQGQQEQQQQQQGGKDPRSGDLLLFMEPLPGCLTTVEAVARALYWLEGAAVHDALMRPLRRLIGVQARFDPSMRARLEGVQHARYSTTKKRMGLRPQTDPTLGLLGAAAAQ